MNDTNMIERVAKAIDNATTSYSIRLTSLVDGVATYSLVMPGIGLEFESHSDAAEYVERKRMEDRARAAIEAMREPTEAQWQAAWAASEDYFCSDATTVKGFRLGLKALLDAA